MPRRRLVAVRRSAACWPALATWVVIAGFRSATASPPPKHTVVGRLELRDGLPSTQIGTRRLWVLLPPGYDRQQRYPVVYAADGQDLFDAATAAGGDEWALDELLAARPPGIPPLLVVGVEAAPEALRDYSPPGSTDGARGDAYVSYLTDVIKPLVDREYSTRADPAATLVLGRGAGAVIALYASWTRPDVFGGAIAIELPDLDRTSSAWLARRPNGSRPRLWIEQGGGDIAVRPSATEILEGLRAGADVQYSIANAQSSPVTLVAAGLRSFFTP